MHNRLPPSFLDWIEKHRTEIFIFFLAFGIRLIYAVLVQTFFGSHGYIAYKDAEVLYLGGAKNLIENGVFSIDSAPPYVPDVYRTPLYTFFVASFIWLKLPFFAIIAVQNFLAGIVSVLIYRLGQVLFSSWRIGMAAAVISAIEPLSIYWNNLLMSDYLFAFFFIFGCYKLFQKNYPVFGLMFGLATLVRPIGLYFFGILLAAAILNAFLTQDKTFGLEWRRFLISIALFFVVLFPWMFRNKILFDTWQLSSAFWYNLYLRPMGEFAQTQGFLIAMPAVPAGYPNPEAFIYSFESASFYKRQFLDTLKKYPLEYLRFHFKLAGNSLIANQYNYLANYVSKPKLPRFFSGVGQTLITGVSVIGWITWLFLYALTLGSFFDRSQRVFLAAFWAILALTALSLGTLGGGKDADMSRYLMPLWPFVSLFALAGLRNFHDYFKRIA